ncbi:Predicted dienelactone hydrolase [Rhizobium sp. NFR07]|uniref:alpha/beta hydrolase family protein n=1 Tax=Rhizobium sp. NFR07 TaxID=1566262 RepID=UPI0008ED8388|nr:alpha/beta fold hydrolase [Rhizobium sp. NFR07]SFA93673.1 Predicted dienelactone hydrolase [Rhizobium sp. NFR07]
MRLTITLFALALCAAAPVAHAADPIGVRKISVVTQDYPRPLAVTVWYPSKGDGHKVTRNDDRIFRSDPVYADATIRDGRFPLVLLSHGSGGRVEGMGWIAAKLAEAGFIVAGPNHPGTTSGDSTPAASPKIWERTQDISVLITALAADRRWQSSLDPSRIGVLGFSLGGITALELAGARPDLDAFIRYCDEEKPGLLDCSWFRGRRGFAGGEFVKVEPFDLRSIDRKRFEQSNRDPRITAVVAIDPGLSTVIKRESLKTIDVPVTLINLGSPGKVPPAVIADQLAMDITGAHYAQIPDADHYSFLPTCQPGALDFLKSMGETDPICDETARPRADIHAELSRLIVDAFRKTLRADN